MRGILLILFILVGPRSWAFQYKIETDNLLKPSLIKAQGLSNHFASEGLWSVRGASFVQAGMPFDFVYVSHNWDKAILIKEGLRAPADKTGIIIRDEKLGGSVFHFQREGSSYVLLALGFSSAELQTLLAPLKPKSSFSKWSLFVNSAQAAEECDNQPKALGNLAESSASLEDAAILRKIGQCSVDAWQGIKKSGEDTLSFFKKLATDPSALWGEMKESFVQLKEFALNIKSEVQSVIASFGAMPTEQKLQVACTMAGQTLMGVAEGLLAGGALAKILPMLVLKLRQSASLLAKLAELKKRGYNVPDLNTATREVLSCAR